MLRFILYITLIYSWPAVAQQTVGVFVNEPEATKGYVLFGNNTETYLIDNCGLIINQWHSAYKPGEAMYLLENGNLLRTGELEGPFDEAGGTGGLFELFNWEGDLLWWYEYADNTVQAHHDIAPLPNGNFLFIAWEIRSEVEAKQMGRLYDGPVWSERIVEIEMIGQNHANVVWEWRLWDHLIQDFDPSKPGYGNIAEHPELVNINFIGAGQPAYGNWVHLNAIDYNEDLDQIVVSSRLFSEIWVIDHSTTTSQAATHTGGNNGKGGDLLYRFGNPLTYNRGNENDRLFSLQHDVRWVTENKLHKGKLMVFNNDALPGKSSIEIWTPPLNEENNYSLAANEAHGPAVMDLSFFPDNLYSPIMSGAHFLSNGNLFICEGATGRFFEINSEEEIVWEYINPVNSNGNAGIQGGAPRFNQTFRTTKYSADYQAFMSRNLSPSIPIEINPWESECYDPELIDSIEPEILIANPANHLLKINSGFLTENISLSIFDLSGRKMSIIKLMPGENIYDISEIPGGIYCFMIFKNSEFFFAEKILVH